MPGKSNDQLEKEHKSIKYAPEDLKDTDAEDEYQEPSKKGFRKNTGKEGPSLGNEGSSMGNPTSNHTIGGAPSNKQLETEQKKEKLRPDELKDTDAEDEFKEGDKKGFRKNEGKARL